MTDYSKWIGTDACKLPEGSVAVVKYYGFDDPCIRKNVRGGLFCVNTKLLPTEEDSDGDATVIAIIKLGEPRPATFADVPAYEAWEGDEGSILWHDGCDMCFTTFEDKPCVFGDRQPDAHTITSDMHRVGMITGVCVDGKPWPVKD